MSSIVQTIQKRTTNKNQSLPVSSSTRAYNGPKPTPRLSSSISLQMQPPPRKSLSFSSVMSWWAWAWAWIVSIFVRDLEMNDEEKHAIGFKNRGSFNHGFFKAKSQVTKLFTFRDRSLLPQTLRYDPPAHGRSNRAPIFG